MLKKPNESQRRILLTRGLDWKDYLVVRALYGSIFFIHKKTGKIKVINKYN